VPFVVRGAVLEDGARKVNDPVRIIDLTPTVLDLAGLPQPKGISGKSLVPLMTGAAAELGLEGYAEAMYPLHHFGWSDLRALRSDATSSSTRRARSYSTSSADPKETTNVFDERRAVGDGMVTRLRAIEQAFEKAPTAAPAGDVDPEVRAGSPPWATSALSLRPQGRPQDQPRGPEGQESTSSNKIGEARDLGRDEGGFRARGGHAD